MTKLELIQKAFGKNWDLLEGFVNVDGWCCMIDQTGKFVSPCFQKLGFTKTYVENEIDIIFNSKGSFWRPKVLNEIENNNGWNCIYSNPVPNDPDLKIVVRMESGDIMEYEEDFSIFQIVTHWRPKHMYPQPLFNDEQTEELLK